MRETKEQAKYRRAAMVLAKLAARDSDRILRIIARRSGLEDHLIVLYAMALAKARLKAELKGPKASLKRLDLEQLRDSLIRLIRKSADGSLSTSMRDGPRRQLKNVERRIRRHDMEALKNRGTHRG